MPADEVYRFAPVFRVREGDILNKDVSEVVCRIQKRRLRPATTPSTQLRESSRDLMEVGMGNPCSRPARASVVAESVLTVTVCCCGRVCSDSDGMLLRPSLF